VMRGDAEFGLAPLLWRRLGEAGGPAGLRRRFDALVDEAGLDAELARGWTMLAHRAITPLPVLADQFRKPRQPCPGGFAFTGQGVSRKPLRHPDRGHMHSLRRAMLRAVRPNDATTTLPCQQASRPEDRIWQPRHNQTALPDQRTS
jgi:hypothetical protein